MPLARREPQAAQASPRDAARRSGSAPRGAGERAAPKAVPSTNDRAAAAAQRRDAQREVAREAQEEKAARKQPPTSHASNGAPFATEDEASFQPTPRRLASPPIKVRSQPGAAGPPSGVAAARSPFGGAAAASPLGGAGAAPFGGVGAAPFAGTLPEGEAEADASSGPLMPCPHCSRSFNAKAHAKHVPLCVKVFQKARKPFNVQEQRLPEEAIVAIKKAQIQEKRGGARRGGDSNATAEKKLNTNWRLQSEAFRNAMKDARVVDKFKKEGRSLKDLPPPRQTAPELDDRVLCPHCGRRFGDQQAERHIPLCANAKVRPNAPPKAGGGKPPQARPKAKR